MTAVPIQLSIDGSLPFDPVALATIPILEHAKLYDALRLDPSQREAAEQAARAVQAGTCTGRAT
jgi:hypothetical protein